ncbi:MAG: sugar phosphate isomerase/epimerase [bacterium]|nr:sugar phosphate isomerase/epimerase [bacterium]
MSGSPGTISLIVCKALWGMTEGESLEDKLRLIHEAGYDGVETGAPDMEPAQWIDLCTKYNLTFVGQIFAEDAITFHRQYQEILPYQPVLINAHGGRDKMTFAEGKEFFHEALRIEAGGGAAVAHETHRGRLLYAPWTAAAYLNQFESLSICADFSHWCCVCESMLGDVTEMVELACRRAIHIHGRVGYEEGPQVPDPRAPEHQSHVMSHEQWWDAIRNARIAANAPRLTFTPEYGPPRYMHTLPYTDQPVASLWDICLWGARRIRQRWA